MRLPKRKTPDERLKLALVKRIERDWAPHWAGGLLELRIVNITSSFTDRGMEVHIHLDNGTQR